MILYVNGTPAEINEYLYGDSKWDVEISEEDNPNIPIGDDDEDKKVEIINCTAKDEGNIPNAACNKKISMEEAYTNARFNLTHYIENNRAEILDAYACYDHTTKILKLASEYARAADKFLPQK